MSKDKQEQLQVGDRFTVLIAHKPCVFTFHSQKTFDFLLYFGITNRLVTIISKESHMDRTFIDVPGSLYTESNGNISICVHL